MDLSRYLSGAKRCLNVIVRPAGGLIKRPGTRFVARTKADGAARLVPFSFSTTQTYILEFGHLYARVYSRGAAVGAPVEVVTPYTAAELRDLGFVQSADVLTIVHPAHPPAEMRRTAHTSWALVVPSFAPSVVAPVVDDWTLTAEGYDSGEPNKQFFYQVTFENDAGEESLASDEKQVTNNALDISHRNALVITLPTGITRANVFKFRGGVYGWIGSTTDGNFLDDGIQADIGITPPRARNPFDATGKYPWAATYFEQRLTLGGSDSEPDTVYLSQAAAFRNFSTSEPILDSDAITFTLASDQVNRVLHMLGLDSLILQTTAAIWRLDRGDRGLTPQLEGGIKQQFGMKGGQELADGSFTKGPAPLRVGVAGLFLGNDSQSVRDLVYDNALDRFTGQDLSLMSQHLLEGRRIVEWAYQASPWPIVWLVRDDGRLLSMTYLREQEVIGWCRHETAGLVESVATVSEGGADAVYLVVRRRLGGAWKRCIERMASAVYEGLARACHVDCGVSVDLPRTVTAVALASPLVVTAPGHGCVVGSLVDLDGVADDPSEDASLSALVNGRRFKVSAVSGDQLSLADRFTGEDIDASAWPAWVGGGELRKCFSVVTGLGHLDGRRVAINADGETHPPMVVAGGQVTLDRPAGRVHVGLPFVAEVETLPLALDPETGGRKKTVRSAQVWLNNTVGLKIGPVAGRLDRWAQRETEDWGEATRAFSGQAEVEISSAWQDGGQFVMRSDEPLPWELLAVRPEVVIGG